MKELIWKIRYAWHMRKRSGADLYFCWQAAVTATECNDSWQIDTPEDAADEEMSYWGD